jgi:hypothetical protein
VQIPRTRILDGASGSWSGRNSLFGGIEVYRVPNMAGVWAQEYWEWRLHALNALLCLTVVGIPFAIWNDLRNAANREIFSHAITLEAARLLGLPCSEEETVDSLTTYSYCRGISRDGLLMRLRADCKSRTEPQPTSSPRLGETRAEGAAASLAEASKG